MENPTLHPLMVEIFDTTDSVQKRALDTLLHKNETEIMVSSIHTAAACDSEPDATRLAYHWVTVVYWSI